MEERTINIPYRIDLAGGWLDQPFVSKHSPGAVITLPVFGFKDKEDRESLNLIKSVTFNEKSGMATSTRKTALKLWGGQIAEGEAIDLAYDLFVHDNPPGKEEVSGAQDSIGIVIPGVTRSHYQGEYWPKEIETLNQEEIINFLEDHISLVPLNPRQDGYKALSQTDINPDKARALSLAADKVWQALRELNLVLLGEGVRESFESQVAMFPNMVDDDIRKFIKGIQERHTDNILGYKLSGAGGGGYLICVTKESLPESIGIKIMREIIRD